MGMGLGESARAALLSRSFAELCRLGEAMGARSETLMGLSGLGDLVLTATSASSRNYAFGLDVGKDLSREELYKPGRPLAEGIATAPALVARAHAHKIELPIAQTTAEILDGRIALADAVPRLMSRPLKTE
jgi:glycerol-3-phosphate dehydrogenase (NAD(P)+)